MTTTASRLARLLLALACTWVPTVRADPSASGPSTAARSEIDVPARVPAFDPRPQQNIEAFFERLRKVQPQAALRDLVQTDEFIQRRAPDYTRRYEELVRLLNESGRLAASELLLHEHFGTSLQRLTYFTRFAEARAVLWRFTYFQDGDRWRLAGYEASTDFSALPTACTCCGPHRSVTQASSR